MADSGNSGGGFLGALGPIGAGIGLLSGILGGIFGKRAHNKYADELMKVNLSMPTAVGQSESIYNTLANQNLPGYNQMLNNLQSNVGRGLTQAESVSSSPDALVNALAQLTTLAGQQANHLGIQNANYRTQGLSNLANYLGTTKAGYQNEINQFNVDKQISAMKERMLGSQELMQGITGGLGSAFANFGAGEQLNFQNQQANALSNYFGRNNSGGVNNLNFSDLLSVLGLGQGVNSVSNYGGSIPGLATASLYGG